MEIGRRKGRILVSIFLSRINHDYPFFEQYMKFESFDRWDLKFAWGAGTPAAAAEETQNSFTRFSSKSTYCETVWSNVHFLFYCNAHAMRNAIGISIPAFTSKWTR